MEERMLMAACLAHIKRADGSLEKDWSIAQIAQRSTHDVLKNYQAHVHLPDTLTEEAFAASEDLRTHPAVAMDWQATQAQAERVLPVVMRLLYVLGTLASSEKAA